jgi:hypothetical protein
MHAQRLKGFGIPEVNAKIFDVNEALSDVTKAVLTAGGGGRGRGGA